MSRQHKAILQHFFKRHILAIDCMLPPADARPSRSTTVCLWLIPGTGTDFWGKSQHSVAYTKWLKYTANVWYTCRICFSQFWNQQGSVIILGCLSSLSNLEAAKTLVGCQAALTHKAKPAAVSLRDHCGRASSKQPLYTSSCGGNWAWNRKGEILEVPKVYGTRYCIEVGLSHWPNSKAPPSGQSCIVWPERTLPSLSGSPLCR